jgi:hypothetical protein
MREQLVYVKWLRGPTPEFEGTELLEDNCLGEKGIAAAQ